MKNTLLVVLLTVGTLFLYALITRTIENKRDFQ